MYFLVAVKVVYILNKEKPKEEDEEIVADMKVQYKWEQDDFLCKGHILYVLTNELYDVY